MQKYLKQENFKEEFDSGASEVGGSKTGIKRVLNE
jgi:hypothetical protein